MESKTSLIRHSGGCHCGSVRFKVLAPRVVRIFDCNCSICVKKQNKHFVVPKSNFFLIKGEDNLTCYTFNTHKAQHLFCKTCGVQSFYIPRSNPDGYGVAPHCLDPGTIEDVQPEKFDGQNWEESFEAHPDIRERSKAN